MEEVALQLELQDDKAKQKTNRTISVLLGVETIVMNNKEKKLTAAEDIDNEYPRPMLAHYARILADKPTNGCVIS